MPVNPPIPPPFPITPMLGLVPSTPNPEGLLLKPNTPIPPMTLFSVEFEVPDKPMPLTLSVEATMPLPVPPDCATCNASVLLFAKNVPFPLTLSVAPGVVVLTPIFVPDWKSTELPRVVLLVQRGMKLLVPVPPMLPVVEAEADDEVDGEADVEVDDEAETLPGTMALGAYPLPDRVPGAASIKAEAGNPP